MLAQPPVGLERRVVELGDLRLRTLRRLPPARVLEVAEAAILVGVWRVHEGAGGEQIEQIAQHVHRLRLGRLRAHLALAPAAHGREVVGADHVGLCVHFAQQLHSGERIESVLELPAGTLELSGTTVGHRIAFESAGTPA